MATLPYKKSLTYDRSLAPWDCSVARGHTPFCGCYAPRLGMHPFGDLIGKVMVGVAVMRLICTHYDNHITQARA
jgi:hypothetical protein